MRLLRDSLGLTKASLLTLLLTADSTAVAAGTSGPYKIKTSTVEDTGTTLVWQRSSSPTTASWTDANAYCSALDLDGKGFRLPTVKELHTLVDESRLMPAIDSGAFPKTESAAYWTATQLAAFPGNYWTISFGHGLDSWHNQSSKAWVRCVR